MTDFLLIRHTTTDDVDDRLAGRIDTPLNEIGFAKARQLADFLCRSKISAIYTSPMQRTLQTAEALAVACGLPVLPDESFIQVNYGDWESVSYEELRENSAWRSFIASPGGQVPGGEHIDGVIHRVTHRLDSLSAAQNRDDVVVIVTHGSIIRFTLAHYLGLPTGNSNRLKVLPGSVNGLRLGGRMPIVFQLNHVHE
jgi:broad specificity phosphatase PhoE